METSSSPKSSIRHSKSAVEVGGAITGGVTVGVVVDPVNDDGVSPGAIYSKANSESVSGETLSISSSSTSTKKIRHSVSFSLKNLGRSSGGSGGGQKDDDSDGKGSTGKEIAALSAASDEAFKDEKDPEKKDLATNSFLSPSDTPSGVGREASSSRSTSRASSSAGAVAMGGGAVARSPSVTVANSIHCKLCLCDYPPREMVQLANCRCLFCADCVTAYIGTAIENGDVLAITCPDGDCPAQFNVIESNQIRQMVDEDTFATYMRFRTLREIENDPNGTWCPSVGCETICHVCRVDDGGGDAGGSGKNKKWSQPRQPVTCPTCHLVFCSVCKSQWHPDGECHNPFLLTSSSSTNFDVSAAKRRSQRAESEVTAKSGGGASSNGGGGRNFLSSFLRRGPAAMEVPGADGSLDSSPIKRCPICHILIEREEGCAQMMCKRCKHVFCWYCLESLDNDFLLRHYDRGPCKNKLGHSRASVIWHRTQVVGIFAGFGMLLLMASPFLLLAAPCILCCKCSCCHCLDIDDVEWYEGKGSPGTREARQKRLAKSFGGVGGAVSSTSVAIDSDDDDGDDEYENVPSFQSWEIKRRKSKDGKTDVNLPEMTTENTSVTTPTGDNVATAKSTGGMGTGKSTGGMTTEKKTATTTTTTTTPPPTALTTMVKTTASTEKNCTLVTSSNQDMGVAEGEKADTKLSR